MKRIALLALLFSAFAFGQRPSPQASQSYVTGRFVAFNYGQWKSPIYSLSAPTGSNVQVTLVNAYVRLPDGRQIAPYNTNAPLLIGRETVTPSAVSNCRIGEQSQNICVVTVTLAQQHDVSQVVSSGTFGLQEALNDAGLIGGSVTVDGSWTAAGGTTGMISGATIPGNVKIEDCRTGCPSSSGSGTVNPGQLAIAQYPTSSASSVSPSNITYDAATGNNLTFGAAANGNAYVGRAVASGIPVLDITSPAYGGVCDGSTDIGSAVQAAWNAAPATGAIILFPGTSTIPCYWDNPTTFNWGIGSRQGYTTFRIVGQLKVGTTLHIPNSANVNVEGQAGGLSAQFQVPNQQGTLRQRPSSGTPVTGTIGTAIATTFTGTGSPTASVPEVCNAGHNGDTYQDTNGIAAILWTCAFTTGNITSGTNQLTVASIGGYVVGDNIIIAGAGSSGGNLGVQIIGVSASGLVYTISTNALTTVSGANVTNNIFNSTNNWRPGGVFTITPSSMSGIFPQTVIGIAETLTCSIPTSGAVRTSNVVVASIGSSCHIPPGTPITVAGMTDSTFNGSHTNGSTAGPFLVQGADYVNNTLQWAQTAAADATSGGGTITGFNEDTPELVNVSSVTSTTLTAVFYRPHASTAQFGAVALYFGGGTGSVQAAIAGTVKDLYVISDGPAIGMEAYRAKFENVGASLTGNCGTNLTNWTMEVMETSFVEYRGMGLNSYCTPWSFHMTRRFNYTVGTNGAVYIHNSVFAGSGIKLDHGSAGIQIDHNSFCEQCARAFVSFDDSSSFWAGIPQYIRLTNSWTQDNPNGFQTSFVHELQPTLGAGLPIVQISQMSGSTANVVNDAFVGQLKTDTNTVQYSSGTPKGVVGTFDNGTLREGENRASNASMSPADIPYQTVNVTTNPASWSVGGCTLGVGIPAPDGTATAGSLSGANNNTVVVGTQTGLTPVVGDAVIGGVWVMTPTAGKKAIVNGTGSVFVMDNNSSTHFQLFGSLSGNLSSALTGVYDAQFVNDWWHPVVNYSYVTQSDGTSGQQVRLNLGCSTDHVLYYWQPFMIYIPIASIPSTVAGTLTSGTFTAGETVTQATSGATATLRASANSTSITINLITGTPDNSHTWTGGTSGAVFTPSATPVATMTTAQFQAEVQRWRTQLMHGSVPANMPGGGGLLAMNATHKLYWGNDTNLYRESAGTIKTDGNFNIGSGKTYQVNGTQIATGNLGDWSNAGVANGNVPVWNSGTGKWVPGSGAGLGNVSGPASAVNGDVAIYDGTTGTLIKDTGILGTNVVQSTVPPYLQWLGDGSESAPSCASGCNAADEHWYASLNVPVGQVMFAASGRGLIIRSTGTCTIAGTISVSANSGSFAGNSGNSNWGGSGGGGGFGAANGTIGSTASPNPGGAGGTSGNPGTIGNAPTAPQQKIVISHSPLLNEAGSITTSNWFLGGSQGGAGGSSGGAGGKGGGYVVIACQTINFTGTIDASGQAGVAGGSNTGGGGGGGGGIVILRSPNMTNSGTINTAGGNGGAIGTGTSTAGGNGGAGWSKVYSQ